MRIRVFFAWYDFWMGCYFDRAERTLYVCPLPMCVVKIVLPGGGQEAHRRRVQEARLLNAQAEIANGHGMLDKLGVPSRDLDGPLALAGRLVRLKHLLPKQEAEKERDVLRRRLEEARRIASLAEQHDMVYCTGCALVAALRAETVQETQPLETIQATLEEMRFSSKGEDYYRCWHGQDTACEILARLAAMLQGKKPIAELEALEAERFKEFEEGT